MERDCGCIPAWVIQALVVVMPWHGSRNANHGLARLADRWVIENMSDILHHSLVRAKLTCQLITGRL